MGFFTEDRAKAYNQLPVGPKKELRARGPQIAPKRGADRLTAKLINVRINIAREPLYHIQQNSNRARK